MVDLQITNIGGACPFQAEGTIDGNPFYFRSRGQGWSFSVSRPGGIPAYEEENSSELTAEYWAFYGDPDDIFGAGWIEKPEAEKLIGEAVKAWEAGLRGNQQLNANPLMDTLRMRCELRYSELTYNKGESLQLHWPKNYQEIEEMLQKHPEIKEEFAKQLPGWLAKVDEMKKS